MPDPTPTNVSIDALRFYPEEIATAEVQAELVDLWESGRGFIVLAGPPGVGKTRAAEDFILDMLGKHEAKHDKEACRITQLFPEFRTRVYDDLEIEELLRSESISFVWDICVLHPQYSYEDLIRGFRMTGSGGPSSTTSLEVREGILGFLSRVVKIMEGIATSKYPLGVLILDEINRAPIGQLFGEALYALDRRGQSVATPYELPERGSNISIPAPLMILGTMNSVDRAISGFDFALRRRFLTLNIAPQKPPIERRFSSFNEVTRTSASKLYDHIRDLILNASQTGIVPRSELIIGHSFFLPPPLIREDDAAIRWLAQSYQFQILPTLLDYQEQGLIEYRDGDVDLVPFGDALKGRISLSLISGVEVAKFIEGLGKAPEEVSPIVAS